MQMQATRTRTAAQTAGLFGMGKFRLTGLFLIIAGLTFLGVAIAINFSTSKSEENRVITATTEQSVNQAMGIAKVVSDLLEDGGVSSNALSSKTTGKSSIDIGGILSESNIVRLNLYSPDGKFIWSEEGDALLNFGRHRGERLAEVINSDPNYLYWMSGSDSFGPEVRKIAESARDGYLPERESVSEPESASASGPEPEPQSESEHEPVARSEP